jgi:adenylate cyclase
MNRTPRILVVDDTPNNVKLLLDLLAVKGYEVASAGSGEEALARIPEVCPDLVLLDVVMPGLSGYDVCRAIRADPSIGILPVIMVTALDPATERVKGLEAGADDFLTKPINQAELLARVRSLLRVKSLYDTVQDQAAQLAEWNRTLERRVTEQVAHRRRRRRRSARESPPGGDGRIPRSPRLHELRRNRRTGGGDGRAARIPCLHGQADPEP